MDYCKQLLHRILHQKKNQHTTPSQATPGAQTQPKNIIQWDNKAEKHLFRPDMPKDIIRNLIAPTLCLMVRHKHICTALHAPIS